MSLRVIGFSFLAVFSLLLFNNSWATTAESGDSTVRKIMFTELAQLVKEKNENVEASRLQMEAQSLRMGRAARSFLPRFSATAGQEQYKKDSLPTSRSGDYWKLEASVNLFRGGRDGLEGQIRRLSHELASVDHQLEFRNELKEATLAYWRAVSINQLLADTEAALEKNEQNFRAAKRRVGTGQATAADAVQFELYRVTLTSELAELELAQDVALNQLSVALALDEHKNIEVAAEYPEIKNRFSDQSVSSANLYVKKQKQLEQIEQTKSQQISRWWWPQIDAYANYALPSLSEDLADATSRDKQWTAGIKLTIDLGQGFEERVEAKAKRQEARAFQNRATHAVRKGLALDHELRHDLLILSGLIKNADNNIELALKFLKLTEAEYNRGAKNGPDLLSATQTYFDFRRKRNEYYRNYLSTEAELRSLIESDSI